METEEVVRSLSRELKPVRPLPASAIRATRWTWVAIASVMAGTFVLGPRHDLLARLQDPRFLSQNVLLLLIFLVCGRVAFELSVPGAARSIVPRAVAVAGVLTWGWMLASDAAPFIGSLPAGWRCVSRMASLALIPSVAVFSMLRRAAALKPAWTGCAALVAVASIATSGMQMICAKGDPSHVLYWHFVPVVACALIGAHLGRFLLRRHAL